MIDVVFTDDSKITVGAVDLFDFEPFHLRAGVGILIGDHKERNKGYAGAALKAIIDYAFDILQLKQLYCNIETDNSASLNLFKKYGFEIIGVKKMWLKSEKGFKDEVMLQLISETF
jgi:diamine N-acetyltransferase